MMVLGAFLAALGMHVPSTPVKSAPAWRTTVPSTIVTMVESPEQRFLEQWNEYQRQKGRSTERRTALFAGGSGALGIIVGSFVGHDSSSEIEDLLAKEAELEKKFAVVESGRNATEQALEAGRI